MRSAIAIVSKLSAVVVGALLFTPLLAGAPPQEPPTPSTETVTHGVQNPKVEQAYTITDLGSLGGGFSWAFDISDRGQVAGHSNLSPDSCTHAFLWERGHMKDLGTLGGPCSYYGRLNLRGQDVGLADIAENVSHAFLWSQGVMNDLGTLGGLYSGANGISLLTDVVGYSEISSIDPDTGLPAGHAFLWQRGVMLDLGTLGGLYSSAFGVNARGQVAGWAELADKDPELGYRPHLATLWDRNGTPTVLGTLGGKNSEAFNITELGQVVGHADLPGDVDTHACLWDKRVIRDLGSPSGYPSSWGWAINNHGQACGTAFSTTWQTGFIWQDGVMTDLNELIPADSGWLIIDARGINDQGQIASAGYKLDTGEFRALLLNPAGPCNHKQSRASIAAQQKLVPPEIQQKIRDLLDGERTRRGRPYRQMILHR